VTRHLFLDRNNVLIEDRLYVDRRIGDFPLSRVLK
jgi:hypothetical protein